MSNDNHKDSTMSHDTEITMNDPSTLTVIGGDAGSILRVGDEMFGTDGDVYFDFASADWDPALTFTDSNAKEVLRMESNGDLYFHGRLIESDEELREAVIGLHKVLAGGGA